MLRPALPRELIMFLIRYFSSLVSAASYRRAFPVDKNMIKPPKAPSKSPGPATPRDPVSAVRLPEALTAQVDAWSVEAGGLSRADAIRRLVEIGLANAETAKLLSPSAKTKASELAGVQIDRLADPTATDEERASRKRRLLKGPEEFRELRTDHPTRKR